MKANKTDGGQGILYFFIHLLIEVTSFYVVTTYSDSGIWLWSALFYDFYAFAPQGFYGYIRDAGVRINFALTGTALSGASLIMLGAGVHPAPTLLVLAVGNGMIHIEGAEATLRSSPGKISPAALFVSGGSFGVIAGRLAAKAGAPVALMLALHLLILIPALISSKRAVSDGEAASNLKRYRFSNKKIPPRAAVALAVTVVAVRAYMGYGIPTSWNKSTAQTVALFCFMGVGKALGGVLCDRLGVRKTALISTLGAFPLLIFGDKVMAVSLVGVMLFSMTMAVTLGVIVSEMPDRPGVAFGLTTLGLFLGSFPVAAYKPSSFAAGCAVVTALTAASAVILYFICKPGGIQNDRS